MGLIVAIPPHVPTLPLAGLPIPVRLTRQFRKAAALGPLVWVVHNEGEISSWQCSAVKEKVSMGTPERLPDALEAAQADAWVFVSADLVFSGEGLSEAISERAASSGNAAGWGIITANEPMDALIGWVQSVCSGGTPAPPCEGGIELPPQKFRGSVTSAERAHIMETQVLQGLRRPQDPNFPRLTHRRFSIPVSLLAVRFGIPANMVTALAIFVGVAGALMIAKAQYPWVLGGAFFLVVSRFLDDCDGEVARLTFRQSRFGAFFDLIGDIAVFLAIFPALGFGLYRREPDVTYLWATGLLVFGAVMTTILLLISANGNRARKKSRLLSFLERSASGDFAYVFFLFALADKTAWFLWGSAVGAQVYWLVLAVVLLHVRLRNGGYFPAII